VHDLAAAFAADGAPWHRLRIDGGMSANDWIAQDMADMLDLPVERPTDVETTARGAAMLAGVGCGLFASLDAASSMASSREGFTPILSAQARAQRLEGWRALLAQTA
jgi:glycerol kinase